MTSAKKIQFEKIYFLEGKMIGIVTKLTAQNLMAARFAKLCTRKLSENRTQTSRPGVYMMLDTP